MAFFLRSNFGPKGGEQEYTTKRKGIASRVRRNRLNKESPRYYFTCIATDPMPFG